MNKNAKQSRFHRIRSIKLNKALLNSIFVAALCILGAISVLSYLELKNLIHSNRWVIHTHTVLNTLDEALYALSSLESDQRGYLITNETSYLQEMDATKSTLPRRCAV